MKKLLCSVLRALQSAVSSPRSVASLPSVTSVTSCKMSLSSVSLPRISRISRLNPRLGFRGFGLRISRLTSDFRPLTSFCWLSSALCLLSSALVCSASDPKFADFPRTPAAPSISTNTATLSTNGMDALDEKYHLAIGDRLSYRIIEDEEDPKPMFVTDSGDLEVPLVGRFPAIGRTCKDLAHALKTELEKEYYYHATVIIAVDIMTKTRGKVYLVGAVRAPGPQDIPSDEALTVSKAILRAGGFTEDANKRNVKVTRKGPAAGAQEQSFIIDVSEILEKGRRDADLPLEPGDLIYVPERLIRF